MWILIQIVEVRLQKIVLADHPIQRESFDRAIGPDPAIYRAGGGSGSGGGGSGSLLPILHLGAVDGGGVGERGGRLGALGGRRGGDGGGGGVGGGLVLLALRLVVGGLDGGRGRAGGAGGGGSGSLLPILHPGAVDGGGVGERGGWLGALGGRRGGDGGGGGAKPGEVGKVGSKPLVLRVVGERGGRLDALGGRRGGDGGGGGAKTGTQDGQPRRCLQRGWRAGRWVGLGRDGGLALAGWTSSVCAGDLAGWLARSRS